MFTLKIHLPVDRRLPGFMQLHNAIGFKLLYDIPCRGKADSQRAAAKGNASRNPVLPWGDAPAGLFDPAQVTVYKPRHPTFGHAAILLEGADGDALKAKQNGRTGLAIHAGRGNDRLMATYGCIRLFGRDMEMLVNTILAGDVQVEAVDCADWPPS